MLDLLWIDLADNRGTVVTVTVTVYVTNDDLELVIVNVLLDEALDVLLFLIDTVDVFVLIIDEVEHGLPLGVFVCLDVTVWLTDELDVLLG